MNGSRVGAGGALSGVSRPSRPQEERNAPVEVEGVRKSFGRPRSTTTVLHEVSLHAPPGKITSILGESGCGKTTLLRIIAGLEEADSGVIRIGGTDVSHVAPARRGVAMVFQNFGLYPAKTVARNIEFPLKMAGVPKAARRARAQAVAELMHMQDHLDRLPAELSGGQRQRVGICRALVREPRVVLMDEPLSNLDARLRAEMRTEITLLQRRLGSTMLTVTHDQTEAMTMSDHIVLMRAGRVEQAGTPDEVFTRPASSYAASFLGGMNLLPGLVEGDRLRWPGGEAAIGGLGRLAGPDVTLGVRAEHLRLTSDPRDAGFLIKGIVQLGELLGADRILHVRAGDATVRVRIDAAESFGEEVALTAHRENIHVFSTKTGKRHG